MAFDVTVITGNWTLFARGAAVTLLVAATSLVVAFALAVPLALMALSRRGLLRWSAAVYLECFRNLPFIVVVYIFFYGLPMLQLQLSETAIGIIALSCFASAYFSEIVRGAILSVPAGQMEAARSMGMSYARGMWEIVAPQTLKFLIPPCTNTGISMLKETSVLSAITVGEITYQGLIVQGRTFAPFEVFLTTASLYWLMTSAFAALMGRTERSNSTTRSAARAGGSPADQFLEIEV
jgi:His/Glu/Gln/Arg/opine family amino acid ABC transporter permease subunit